MCKEYLIERTIIEKTEKFTADLICHDVKKSYNVEVDVKSVQQVLSSYISDGIVSYDEKGYKKSENMVICW